MGFYPSNLKFIFAKLPSKYYPDFTANKQTSLEKFYLFVSSALEDNAATKRRVHNQHLCSNRFFT